MRKAVNATTSTSFRGAPGKVSRRPVWEPLHYGNIFTLRNKTDAFKKKLVFWNRNVQKTDIDMFPVAYLRKTAPMAKFKNAPPLLHLFLFAIYIKLPFLNHAI